MQAIWQQSLVTPSAGKEWPESNFPPEVVKAVATGKQTMMKELRRNPPDSFDSCKAAFAKVLCEVDARYSQPTAGAVTLSRIRGGV